MDQILTGSAGIASGEAFGTENTGLHQTMVVGSAGIPSGEAFPRPAGVFIDPATVPYSVSVAY